MRKELEKKKKQRKKVSSARKQARTDEQFAIRQQKKSRKNVEGEILWKLFGSFESISK